MQLCGFCWCFPQIVLLGLLFYFLKSFHYVPWPWPNFQGQICAKMHILAVVWIYLLLSTNITTILFFPEQLSLYSMGLWPWPTSEGQICKNVLMKQHFIEFIYSFAHFCFMWLCNKSNQFSSLPVILTYIWPTHVNNCCRISKRQWHYVSLVSSTHCL